MHSNWALHCPCCQCRSGLPFTCPKIQQRLWNDFSEEAGYLLKPYKMVHLFLSLSIWNNGWLKPKKRFYFVLCTDTVNILTSLIPQFCKISISIISFLQTRILKYIKIKGLSHCYLARERQNCEDGIFFLSLDRLDFVTVN